MTAEDYAITTARQLAVTTIARDLLASLLAEHGGTKWGYYPDLDERSWDDVLGRAKELAGRPNPEPFNDAYKILAADPEASR